MPASASVSDTVGNPLAGLPYTGGEAYTLQHVLFLPMMVKAAP
jgi:hypothetical protein